MIAATGLRRSAATEVAEGQEHDVEPGPVGAKVIGVAGGGLEYVRCDQHSHNSWTCSQNSVVWGCVGKIDVRPALLAARAWVRRGHEHLHSMALLGDVCHAVSALVSAGAGEIHSIDPRMMPGAQV